MIKFGSVCSGIEAASVAWHPLGWRAAWLAEIEPFPSAVLAHHYPEVVNLGDMTAIARRVLAGDVVAPEILVGGTPCQAFSIAGLRASLDDARGNLTLKFVELADAIDFVRARSGLPESIITWENVPGVLSTKDNAFGCFLAGLAGEDEPLQPAGKRWSNAGCVYGPKRAIAWRTLDAQYFGLAQRRRRVFVVASARNGFDPARVLPEWQSLRRDSAPRRAAREETAASLTASAGHHGYSSPRGDGSDNLIVGTLRRTDGGSDVDHAQANHLVPELLCVAHGQAGAEIAAEMSPTLSCNHEAPYIAGAISIQAGALRENPASGPDGIGIRTDDCAYTIEARAEVQAVAVALRGREGGATAELGDDAAFTLRASTGGGDKPHVMAPAICFSAKDHDADAGELAPTLRAMGSTDGRPNGGGQVAVAFQGAGPLDTDGHTIGVQQAMQVRRLTPVECSRLQGFPDDYLELTYANADEAHAAQVLHELWREAGTPAVEEQGWRTGIAAALLTPEILLAGVHVGWLSWEMAARCAAARGALPGEVHNHEGFVCALRREGQAGRSPFGREPFEQLARELGGHLSFVPFEGAQARALLRGSELWSAAQARWPLRYALAKGKARETPDRMNPDGPRYKALGNSMAVPVMRWIGERIEAHLSERHAA